jgi:DNA-binding beta-propeller fold protein YncE
MLMRIRRHLVIATIGILTVACGGPTEGAGVPNPFTIVERFSADSLGLEHVLAFDIGPDGDLYILDADERVVVVSPDGRVVDSWGKRGTGPGEFRFDRGEPSDPFDILAKIAVGPDGHVFVSDPGGRRIEEFTARGRFLTEIGSAGGRRDQFRSPNWLAVDDHGNLYVADDEINVVMKFSSDGRWLWTVGGDSWPDPKQFVEPHLGLVDSHGRLVMKNGFGMVLFLDQNGNVVDSFQSEGCDPTVDRLGYLYVNARRDGCDPGLTQAFDRRHHLVGEWLGPGNPFAKPPRFAPNGDAFTVDLDQNVLQLEISIPGR